jgi:hypothetical protein
MASWPSKSRSSLQMELRYIREGVVSFDFLFAKMYNTTYSF